MAEIVISQQWLDSLSRYLNDLQDEAVQRAESAVQMLQDKAREKARHTPGWDALADEINVWSADGLLHIGVSNEEFLSQAWVLEYGDQHHAPNPLLRTLRDEVDQVNEHAVTAASVRYGRANVS